MNYEVKAVSPVAVLINALRIFIIVGFLVGILSFFVMPNTNPRIATFGQKFVATLIFTGAYTVAVSLVLTLVAWLYNVWSARFKGITIRLEQNQ
jgi:hypothetical protein